jgi:hypothetical protein
MDRRLRLSLSWALSCALAWVLTGAHPIGVALGDELIRYRRADGSIGFTGSRGDVPPGAAVLSRKPSSQQRDRALDSPPLRLDRALSGVRGHCESRHRPASAAFEACLADHTQAVFQVRDAIATQQPGSEAERLNAGCRRRWERDRLPDYRRLANCIEDAHEDFQLETGFHPAQLDASAVARDGGGARGSQGERLRSLRDDQARTSRELDQGRATWGPRYRTAERELEAAESKTRAIIDRMKRRGCRVDSLGCGGLPEQLEAARREEREKRDYLTNGIVSECRLAGCQPGWLR